MKRTMIPFVLLIASIANAEEIKHRFLAVDESRSQLHYVDQVDASNDWTIQFPDRYRDVQLVDDRVIVSTYDGYEEYDFQTQEKVKAVADAKFGKTENVMRLSNGHTILGCNAREDGKPCIRIFELDAGDNIVRHVAFPNMNFLRLLNLAKDGSLLFGSNNQVVRAQWDGSLSQFTVPSARHIYEVQEITNGNYVVSCGYGITLEEWTADGKFVRRIGGGKTEEGPFYLFFGRAQQLDNGNWVVSNWTGHGAQDSQKGAQLIEFNEQGDIVWNWHDPERSGSVHGIIVLK